MSKRKKSPQINLKKLSADFIADLQNHPTVKNLQQSIDNGTVSFEDGFTKLSNFLKNSPSFKSVRTSSKSVINDINKLSIKLLNTKTNKVNIEEKVTQTLENVETTTENVETKVLEKDLSFCKDNDCSSIIENLKNGNVTSASHNALKKVISSEALDCLKANEPAAPTSIDTLTAFAANLKSAMENLFEKCNPFTQINFASLNTKPLLAPIFDSVQAEYCSGENMPGECSTPHEFV
jgi:hypothetical protein